MPKHGKRYRMLSEKVDTSKSYTVEEAVKLVKELGNSKFNETVELAVKLGVDPRKADQMVRGSVVLPHGTGKKVKILVFTRGNEDEAKEAGADYVGFTDLIEKVKRGWLDFDYVIATPEAMPEVAKLGRILGPRGLMPSPKTGTVTKEVGKVVSELKRGRIDFKVDRTGNIHVPLGKVSFDIDSLKENLMTFMEELLHLRPPSFKGSYINSAYLSTTMSPSIKLDLMDLLQRIKK